MIFATLISLRYYSRTSILSEIRKIFKFPESIVIQYFTTTPSTHTSQYAFQKLSNDAVKAIVSCCKSYAFMVWKLSNDSVKAMLLHRKVIAFTKKKVWKHSFSPLIAVFYALFFSSLHFFVDKIQRAKSPKCPILRILN